MERMAVLSRDCVPPVLNLTGGWRSPPPRPYSLVPATRRFEWLALVVTPIGGIMAVVDSKSAGGIGVWCAAVALLIGVPWAIREALYRLPLTVARALFAIVSGAVVIAVLMVLALLFLISPLIIVVCGTMFALYGLAFTLLRDRTSA